MTETRPRYELSTFVAPDVTPHYPTLRPVGNELTTVAGDLMRTTGHTGHARQDDDAMTHAKATLLVAAAYILAAGMITLGLLLIVWLFRGLGERFAPYAYTGLIVWGIAILAALWGNRRQALWHSPTGIAHHELDMREAIAMHAIDTHAALLLRQLEEAKHER